MAAASVVVASRTTWRRAGPCFHFLRALPTCWQEPRRDTVLFYTKLLKPFSHVRKCFICQLSVCSVMVTFPQLDHKVKKAASCHSGTWKGTLKEEKAHCHSEGEGSEEGDCEAVN